MSSSAAEAASANIHPLPRSHEPFAWEHDGANAWASAIRDQVSKLRPYALILNAGLWPNEFNRADFVADVAAAALRDAGIPRLVWRTTTAYVEGGVDPQWVRTENAVCARVDEFECLNVTHWTSKLHPSFYIDGAHFREPVYRRMNEQLFDLLGLSLGENGGDPWDTSF